MDLRHALLKAVWDLLTGDAALQALCGGTVRLIDGMPLRDTDFPYLTQAFDLEVSEKSWALQDGTWLLDIWDHSPNADLVLEIRHRVITLMDQRILQPTGGEIKVAQVMFKGDSKGPTDSPSIYRLMTRWDLFLDRQVEVEAVLSR